MAHDAPAPATARLPSLGTSSLPGPRDEVLVRDEVLLPERARLFHVGPPKTATTAVQHAASLQRDALMAHGVRYPGRGRHHRKAVAALLGRADAWAHREGRTAPAVPGRVHWDRLVEEMDADPVRRMFFGHEFAAGADDDTARRIVGAVGPRAHVVVTLRAYGRMLPSIWQQSTKLGSSEPFEPWLRRNLAEPRPRNAVESFHRRFDQGALVRRWADAAGAENVTVLVLDPARPRFVFTAFEAMLGLPVGLLADVRSEEHANRGLTVPELELLRRFNVTAREHDVRGKEYEELLTFGAATRLAMHRRPSAGEPRPSLPDWAADRADEDGARYADEIAAAGVRVVGDLDVLRAPSPRGGDEQAERPAVEQVPLDAAVAALEGLYSAALGRGPSFDPPHPRPVSRREVGELTTRELLGVVAGRVRHRMGAVVRRSR